MSPHDAKPEKAGASNGTASAGAPAGALRYDVGFEFAQDCQLLTDLSGIILNVNHVGIRYFGVEKGFLIGKPVGVYFITGTHSVFYDYLARIARGSSTCSFQTQIRLPRQQQARDVLLMGVVSAPGVIRWAIHDNTAWKEAEFARGELLRKLVTAQDDERRRLARDLHDNAGQLLTALRIALGTAMDVAVPAPVLQSLELAKRMADELSRVLHHISHGLRSGLIEEAGLYAAIRQLVSEWTNYDTSVAIDLVAEPFADTRLPLEVETAVYSLIQEALTNVFRHARAHHVRVGVVRKPVFLEVTIKDDGIGFDATMAAHQSAFGRLGLAGMRERIALVGGTFEIATAAGKGTIVTANVPIPESV